MQINNNQCHYPKSTSFGMALKITPKAEKALEEASMETIEKLQKVGEALKDTKYYHLEIGENLTPRIDSPYANSYVPPFKPIKPAKYDEFLPIETTWDGTNVSGVSKGNKYHVSIQFNTAEQAQKAYDKLNNMHSDLDRAVEITKLLDEKEVKKIEKQNADNELKVKIKAAALDLINKFGAPSHEKF